MNRKTLIAIAACAALGIVAAVALRQPEKGEGTGDRQRPLAKIDPAALDTLTVTRAGATTTLVKDGAKYKVTAPVAAAADDVAAKAAFDAVAKLELGDLVSENKTKHAEFEVDDVKAVHVVAKSAKGGGAGGAVLADLLVGKSTGSGTMVRLAGQDQVWLADAGLRPTLDKSPTDWRDKSITTFAADDAQIVTVKAKDGGVAIAKKAGKTSAGAGTEDKWDLVTSVPQIDKIDNSIPSGIVSTLSAFKTNDFADGAAPATTGLDAPALTVTVTLKGGKNVTVLIGNKKGDDDFYVKAGDAPQVFLVKKYLLDRVDKRPIEFKDKQLCNVPEADLTEVAVTHGADSYTLTHAGTAWKATKPAGLALDPAKTPSIGGAFNDWKAAGFAEDATPATTGLGKPRATLTAKSKKGAVCAFKVGDDTKDKQNVYVQAPKGGDVLLAPKWSIDRLLVKVDDIKKK
jgi:hypothetical protein